MLQQLSDEQENRIWATPEQERDESLWQLITQATQAWHETAAEELIPNCNEASAAFSVSPETKTISNQKAAEPKAATQKWHTQLLGRYWERRLV